AAATPGNLAGNSTPDNDNWTLVSAPNFSRARQAEREERVTRVSNSAPFAQPLRADRDSPPREERERSSTSPAHSTRRASTARPSRSTAAVTARRSSSTTERRPSGLA